MRNLDADGSLKADFIPVDTVANMVLAAAAERGSRALVDEGVGSASVSSASEDDEDEDDEQVPVYNCTSGASAPLFWHEIRVFTENGFRKIPDEEVIRWPTIAYRRPGVASNIYRFLEQWLPMATADIGRILSGASARYLRMNNRLSEAERIMGYFCNNEWTWSTGRNDKLSAWLSPSDRRTFDFDLKRLDWESFFDDYVSGIRKFCLKQRPETLAASRRRLERVRLFGYILQLLSATILPLLLIGANRLGARSTLTALLAKLTPAIAALRLNAVKAVSS